MKNLEINKLPILIRLLIAISVLISVLYSANDLYSKSVMKEGDYNLSKDMECDDLVISEGTVVIDGLVNGYVFTVSSDVIINKSAKVLDTMMINNGNLYISKDAILPKLIVLYGAELFINNKKINQKGKFRIDRRTVILRKEVPSPQTINVMRRYLIFTRPIPLVSLSNIYKKDISCCGLKLLSEKNPIYKFSIGNLANINISSKFIKRSLEKNYKKDTKYLSFRIFEFNNSKYCYKFWRKLSKIPEKYFSDYLYNPYGDGAHLFFRYGKSYYLLWYKDNYFLCIEAKDISNESILSGRLLRNSFANYLSKLKTLFY